jgi:insertion element IS1 protein InsB
MAFEEICCNACNSTNVVLYGTSDAGKQRYKCNEESCEVKTFICNYSNLGCLHDVKEKISEMSLNGSGVLDTARVLNISKNTVISELKKKSQVLKK